MKAKTLEAAIRAGDLAKVRKIIAAGVDVSAALADGTTPIQLAAREKKITILRALAAAGADLADLAFMNLEERLKLFLESTLDEAIDEDLMSTDELSAWALEAAAEKMDKKTAAGIAALEKPLFRAVRTGDLELLKERLAGGDDVDEVMSLTRDTPLTQALRARNEVIVRELLAAGADVDYAGYSTPLCCALPDLSLAKLLIEADADLYARGLDRMTPLARAVHRTLHPTSSEDSLLLVRFFLESGVHPPDAESGNGELLMEAELDEAWELYQELLPHYPEEVARTSFEELGYHYDLKEYDGGALQWKFDLGHAAREGDLEELRKLLARRPDELAREAGLAVRGALAHLRGKPQIDAVRILIDAGADLDAAESYERRRGSSPLAAAAESWHRDSKKAMRLLLDAGAAVDQRGSFGRTPLMYAVTVAYRHGAALDKAVPLLLGAGADPNLEDDFGLTAWSLAKAPLIEAEERGRRGEAPAAEPFFDGPDLSELSSPTARKADQRHGRLERCRAALELLEAAGAVPHGEAELRLVLAAAAGDADRLGELLTAGARADARGTDGRPAVVAAAESGESEIVGLLTAARCDVGASMAGVPSALEVAVRAADTAMTRLLLDAGANPVMVAAMSSGALKAADAAGGAEVVELIRSTLPPELAHIDHDIEREIAAEDLSYESQRALPRQAAIGDLDKVRELLAINGVEVDGFDALRSTALAAAAEAGRIEMVRELIACGADVGRSNGVVGSPRSTPLAGAAISPSAERDTVLRLLLEAGADPNQLGADGRTALMHAVERDVGFFGRTGDFALSTRTLIAAGTGLEIRDPYGLTAWMRAKSLAASIEVEEVAKQYEAVARLLEEAGASTAGLGEVELAIYDAEGVRKLLAAGADPDARRHDGSTALMLAVRDGEREIAELLIDAGCDVDARQWVDRGPTAMDAAVAARDQELVRMLKAAGASPPADEGRRNRTASPLLPG